MNRIHHAYEQIQATGEMKAAALARLRAERERRRARPGGRQGALAAACAAFLVMVGLGVYRLAGIPVCYVSIDVNPSVELTLNRFDHILSAAAYNEEGGAVLDGLALTGKHYTRGIELLLGSGAMEPYLTADAALTFTVAAPSREKEDELLSGIRDCAGYGAYGGQGYCAGLGTVGDAHASGMSFGKYAASQTLLQCDETATLEECRHMSMREICDRIRACEGGNLPTDGGNGRHGHGGAGYGWGRENR